MLELLFKEMNICVVMSTAHMFISQSAVFFGITSTLRAERNLVTMIRAPTLTADPSFDEYWEPSQIGEIEGHERLFIPLCEMTDLDKEAWVEACKHETCYWVAVASKSDLSKQQLESMNEAGVIIHTVKKDTKSCLNVDGGKQENASNSSPKTRCTYGRKATVRKDRKREWERHCHQYKTRNGRGSHRAVETA